MNLREIQGEGSLKAVWRRLIIEQGEDGQYRVSVTYDKKVTLDNGEVISQKIPSINVTHEEIINDPLFVSIYPLLSTFTRTKLKDNYPSYVESPEEASEGDM